MLVSIAIADSYGAGFEGCDPDFVAKNNNLTGYLQHAQPGHMEPGKYTDDTQMTIAIAEAMLNPSGWSKINIANKFVEVFKRDPRDGYARKFQAFLQEITSGEEFLAKIKPDSARSGGAMRAAPLGLVRDIDDCMQMCALQASITHNTVDGINAAMAASLMSHYFFHNYGPKEDLGKFIESKIPQHKWASPWVGRVDLKGISCVHAAIAAVMSSSKVSELLKTSIGYTGDVDTVAAIAMGASYFCNEIENDLPPVFLETLENGAFGRDFLKSLDDQLIGMMQKKTIDI